MSLIPFPSNGDKAPETMGTHDNKPPSACSALDSPPLGSASLPLLTHSGGSPSSVKCQHRAASGCAPTLRLTNRDVLGSAGGPTPYPSPTTSAFPFSLYFFVWRKKNHLSCSISAVPDTGRMQRQERAPLVRPRGFDPNQVIDATPQQKMRKLLMFVTVRASVDYV